MTKPSIESVAAYIALQPKPVQASLRRIRAIIRKAVPNADETISYRIPTYKLDGVAMLYFAAWKRHYALYPAGAELLAFFADDLTGYEIVHATIRFPWSKPVPAKLIARIAKFRAKEIARRAKS